MGKLSEEHRAFIESLSTGLPRGVSGKPDASSAETVAAHNRRLNEQHAANRALGAARARAGELENAIRARKIALGVANDFHELPREGRKEARAAVYDADDRLAALLAELAAVEAEIVELVQAVESFGEG